MASPYIGEIRMFCGNFAPAGWNFCNGALLAIAENDTLFNLIGTTYGGDGQNTFALPDLQGRLPVHMGTGGGGTYTLAQTAGAESVTLTGPQLPPHSHPLGTASAATTASPAGAVPADAAAIKVYGPPTSLVGMTDTTDGGTGGSQPHDNLMPYLCINFIISLFGVYPSPT